MQTNSNIAKRLTDLRVRANWTQTELAAQLGVSRNYVSMIEQGREPGRKFLVALEHLESRVLTNAHTPARLAAASPREKLALALTRRGLSVAQLAKLIRYNAGVIENVINGTGKASESMIEAIVRELPELTKEDLMHGSDDPQIVSESGTHGTYGAKPSIALPPGVKGRMVPLLSMAQAGAWDACHDDGGYTGEAVFALNVDDRRAFAIKVTGNSMEPDIQEGDIVICSPTVQLTPGCCAVVRTRSEQAFVKFWRRKGDEVVLESANPAYRPIHFPATEILGAWPVVQRISPGLIRRKAD